MEVALLHSGPCIYEDTNTLRMSVRVAELSCLPPPWLVGGSNGPTDAAKCMLMQRVQCRTPPA